MNIRRSLAFSLLDRYAGLVVTIVATMILARLLTPAELGVYSLAMALLAMAATVRDMGAGNYLLQEPDLTADRVRAVWALQLGLGLGLALIVAALSGPVAAFYAEPDIQSIMLILALNYLVNPVGSLTYAWLMREMRYDALALMRLSSALSGAVVSVFLAWRGAGAISLAWGGLCSTVVNAVVSMAFRPDHFPWMPGLKEIRRVLSFGVRMTSTSIMNSLAIVAPEFLLGKTQGMAAVGFYSRANGLVSLFSRLVTDAVYSVALSMFSQRARAGLEYSDEFVRALSYVTVLSWPFFGGLALLAHPTILLLYGPQWVDSVALTRWLAFATAVGAPISLCTAALIGSGAMAAFMRVSAVTLATTVVAAGVGAAYGLAALGPALALGSVVAIVFWLKQTRGRVGFSWAAMARASGQSAAVALVTLAGPLLSVMVFGHAPASPWAPLLLGAAVGVPLFVLAVLRLGHPLGDELVRAGVAGRLLMRRLAHRSGA